MTRGRAALLTIGLVFGVIVTASRPWFLGTVDDAVLGQGAVSATGDEAAPGLVALTLVAAAALLAALVTRARIRRPLLAIGILAAVGASALVAVALADPGRVLGPLAAQGAGRTGSLSVAAHATGWAWTGAVVAFALTVVLGWCLADARGWPEPTRSYDREPTPGEATGRRGEQARSDWEALSAGDDPTDVTPPRAT